jgi:hypothetical protein
MKWKIKIKKDVSLGTIRKIKKIALVPTKVEGYWIWLEPYIITQKYTRVEHHIPETFNSYFVNIWVTINRRLIFKKNLVKCS